MLKLAKVLTGSDDSHRHELGYLVRKWKDRKLPLAERRQARKKIDELEAELARRKEEKRRVLEHLKAKAAKRIGRGEELGLNDHTHPNVEGCSELTTDSTGSTEDVPISAEPHPQEVMPNHWPYFEEVFMVSALDGDGILKLKVRTLVLEFRCDSVYRSIALTVSGIFRLSFVGRLSSIYYSLYFIHSFVARPKGSRGRFTD